MFQHIFAGAQITDFYLLIFSNITIFSAILWQLSFSVAKNDTFSRFHIKLGKKIWLGISHQVNIALTLLHDLNTTGKWN